MQDDTMQLTQEKTAPVGFCAECGQPLYAQDQFCGNCGTATAVSFPRGVAGAVQEEEILAEEEVIVPEEIPVEEEVIVPEETPVEEEVIVPEEAPVEEEAIAQEETPVEEEAYTPEETTDEQPATKMKSKKLLMIALIAVGAVAVIAVALIFGIPFIQYRQTIKLMEEGRYEMAIAQFQEKGDYLDSEELLTESKYLLAQKQLEEGEYVNALTIFTELDDYKDSREMVLESKYMMATQKKTDGEYLEAVELFTDVGDYKDSLSMIQDCKYLYACDMLTAKDYQGAMDQFVQMQSYKDSSEKVLECKYQLAVIALEEGKIVDAHDQLAALGAYKDSKTLLESIEDTYQMIIAKPKIFVNYFWSEVNQTRIWVTTSVINENTLRIKVEGSSGADDHSSEELTGEWDPATGRVNFTGKSYRTQMGKTYCDDENVTGYLYYKNGYLYLVYGGNQSGRSYAFR